MEVPAVVKSNLSPKVLIGLALGLFAIFAIADFFNLTPYVLYPYTQIKAKFGTKTS